MSDFNLHNGLFGFQPYTTGYSVECPQCFGEGETYVEVWVDTLPNGGFIEERMGRCDMCDGTGQVHDYCSEDYDNE